MLQKTLSEYLGYPAERLFSDPGFEGKLLQFISDYTDMTYPDSYRLPMPTNVSATYTGGNVTVTCDPVPYAMGYSADISSTPTFHSILGSTYGANPSLTIGTVISGPYYVRIKATTTNPGNTDSAYANFYMWRPLSSQPFATSGAPTTLDSNSYSLIDRPSSPNNDGTRGTGPSGVTVQSVTQNLITLTGGQGYSETSTYNATQSRENFTRLRSLVYPRSLHNGIRASTIVTIGSLNQAENDRNGGGGISFAILTFGYTSFFHSATIQTTNLEGNFGKLRVSNEFNGQRWSLKAFTSLNIGDRIKITYGMHKFRWFAIAEKLDNGGLVTETLDTIYLDTTLDTAAQSSGNLGSSFYGIMPEICHYAGTHSYTPLILESSVPQSPDLAIIGDSLTANFPGHYEATYHSLLAKTYPDKYIASSFAVGYQLASWDTDTFLQSEQWALKPKAFLFCLGTNDGTATPSQMATYFTNFYNAAQTNVPGCKVYFRSIPIEDNSSPGGTRNYTRNNAILAQNVAIQAAIGSLPNAVYLELNTEQYFKDPRGNFVKTKTVSGFDRIHWTDTGHALMAKMIINSGILA